MDQMMGAGDGGIGGQAGFPLEQWFWEMPLCTRWWTTATVLTSALVQCQIVTPFQLFYSFRAVFVKSQVRPTIRLTLHVGQL
jgi:Derlin-2/3